MLRVEELRKSFGGVSAMNGVSLSFEAGSLTAIIGPNGAGKTTFFNLITGAFRPDSGRVLLEGEDIEGLPAPEIVRRGMGRAFQIASIFPTLTVREAILVRIPLGRMGAAEEVADVVAYLATRASYVHGTVLHVNGGMYGG